MFALAVAKLNLDCTFYCCASEWHTRTQGLVHSRFLVKLRQHSAKQVAVCTSGETLTFAANSLTQCRWNSNINCVLFSFVVATNEYFPYITCAVVRNTIIAATAPRGGRGWFSGAQLTDNCAQVRPTKKSSSLVCDRLGWGRGTSDVACLLSTSGVKASHDVQSLNFLWSNLHHSVVRFIMTGHISQSGFISNPAALLFWQKVVLTQVLLSKWSKFAPGQPQRFTQTTLENGPRVPTLPSKEAGFAEFGSWICCRAVNLLSCRMAGIEPGRNVQVPQIGAIVKKAIVKKTGTINVASFGLWIITTPPSTWPCLCWCVQNCGKKWKTCHFRKRSYFCVRGKFRVDRPKIPKSCLACLRITLSLWPAKWIVNNPTWGFRASEFAFVSF